MFGSASPSCLARSGRGSNVSARDRPLRVKGSYVTQFEDLGLAPGLTERLAEAGLKAPTPIQEKAIPLALEGRDVLGLAQTGTGKTLAFGLPLMHRLLEQQSKPLPRSVKALVLAPTRELVNQIADNPEDLCRGQPPEGAHRCRRPVDQPPDQHAGTRL